MRQGNTTITNGLLAPVRRIIFRADVFAAGSDSVKYSIWDSNKLVSATIEKVGEESKFFGYGICQKLNIKAIDKDRAMTILTTDKIRITYGVNNNTMSSNVYFYPTETNRDEKTNQLSITAYDQIYRATEHTLNELELEFPYTIKELAQACANFLGLTNSIKLYNVKNDIFNLSYPEGGNFDGTETVREVLNAIAEATQTIYYIDESNFMTLAFKRLDRDGIPVFNIDKSLYFDLETGENKRLGVITSATELGDNVSASTTALGSTQIMRDNPLLDMRLDIADLLDDAIQNIGGLTINPFECSWRGNFLLEMGDKLTITTKDDKVIYTFLLDETLTYNGGLSSKIRWKHSNEEEAASNPTSLQDILKQTYAKVDKANKEIELVASKTEENTQEISAIRLNTDSIVASVEKVETNVNDALESVNKDIERLTSRVNNTITPEDLKIEVEKELDNGVDKVITTTGFTFDENGLNVSKTGSEMNTQITEDGMTVFRNDEAVLIANNVGVEATNLHANTYLIIGTYSRFEDYKTSSGAGRTGCFWIGE